MVSSSKLQSSCFEFKLEGEKSKQSFSKVKKINHREVERDYDVADDGDAAGGRHRKVAATEGRGLRRGDSTAKQWRV